MHNDILVQGSAEKLVNRLTILPEQTELAMDSIKYFNILLRPSFW